jgi:hypothetical protein
VPERIRNLVELALVPDARASLKYLWSFSRS